MNPWPPYVDEHISPSSPYLSTALAERDRASQCSDNPKQRISSKEGDKAVYMTRLRLLRRRIGQAVLMRAFGSADKAISKLLDRAGFTKRARASMAFL
ncbi:hypothetical protein ADUPG1_001072 [Aduncisulcus paluster]|uniref:Uncharacterized protein n=1 Tax=Aduncisulcus paluster TaxID=2918883 RepID=A0ABQ5K9C8_9EUKA|nr:hypothetical protein ADUPG1_001072 [Aduncisulcus paluster]